MGDRGARLWGKGVCVLELEQVHCLKKRRSNLVVLVEVISRNGIGVFCGGGYQRCSGKCLHCPCILLGSSV